LRGKDKAVADGGGAAVRPGSGANQNARRAAARDHVGSDLVTSRERDVEDVRQDGVSKTT
jgi:hypothetical protein